MSDSPAESSPNPPSNGNRYSPNLAHTTCLLVLAVLACGAVLYWLRPVVVPFLVALALYYLLHPVKMWLRDRVPGPQEMKESLAVLGTGLLGLVMVGMTGMLLWACVVEITRDADVYTRRVTEFSKDPAFAKFIDWVGIERDPETGQYVLITPEQSLILVRTAMSWLQVLIADTSLVLVFLLFMLMGRTDPNAHKAGLPAEAAMRVRKYLVEMFLFSVVTGLLVGGFLGILGVKFWLSFGILAFLLNFIPTIGPILATLLPLPVILLDPNLSLTARILAVVLPASVQIVIGNIIQPRFQSRTQGVHPVATMMALMVFGMLWGPVGAVLAVPMTAVLKIAFERVPGGQTFANLLAGKLEVEEERDPAPREV